MRYQDYCDAINAQIEITRYANQNERWCAKFKYCEVKEGGILSSETGNGNSPMKALRDYLGKIEGKRIVFNAYSDSRREFTVPMGLTIDVLTQEESHEPRRRTQ